MGSLLALIFAYIVCAGARAPRTTSTSLSRSGALQLRRLSLLLAHEIARFL
jgi:hypothetical protein